MVAFGGAFGELTVTSIVPPCRCQPRCGCLLGNATDMVPSPIEVGCGGTLQGSDASAEAGEFKPLQAIARNAKAAILDPLPLVINAPPTLEPNRLCTQEE